MNDDNLLLKFDSSEFVDEDTERYSVWVYRGGGMMQAYREQMPNTEEVWFRFHRFSHYYWKLLEDECIDEQKDGSFYNFSRIKIFMIKRMLCETSIPEIMLERDKHGVLTDESYSRVMSIHPRILRVLMDKVEFFPKPMRKSEEKNLEKQCARLFGKGEGLTNPHEYITFYCNLESFWEKFGMNYFDLLKLPQEVFSALKKVMILDNMHKNQKLDEMSHPAPPPKPSRVPPPPPGGRVKF